MLKMTRRLDKQLNRLPNSGVNLITDVGLDEASPIYRAQAPALVRILEHLWLKMHAKWRSTAARYE